MRTPLSLAAAGIVAGCASLPPPEMPKAPPDIAAIKTKLDRNFTIQPHSPFLDWHGEYPVAGDCETYAHAAQALLTQAGYKAKIYYANDESCYARGTTVIHAIACTDQWCVDMYGGTPVLRQALPYELH